MEKYLSATLQTTVLLTIFTTVFFINALIYLFRLIFYLIWHERRSCPYRGLWGLPYGLVILLGIHPPGTFNCRILEICLFLWLFALSCAIIQAKVSSSLTWRLWLEDRMEHFFEVIAEIRTMVLKTEGWLDRLSRVSIIGRIILLTLGMLLFAGVVMSIPTSIFLLGPLLYLCVAFFQIYQSVHSCRKLLGVWFSGSVLIALAGVGIVFKVLPNGAVNSPLAYMAFVLLVAFCWGLTALIADYDVAKMAGGIVNTGTTILVLAVNVIFAWCKMNVYVPLPEWDFDYLIYGCNVILLPLVAAGFLAALLVESQEYYRKKYGSEDNDSEDGDAEE